MLNIALIIDQKKSLNFVDFVKKYKDKIKELSSTNIKINTVISLIENDFNYGDYNLKSKTKNIKFVFNKYENKIIKTNDILIDLSSGEKSLDYILNFLKMGKKVVSSNKKLIAKKYSSLNKIAAANKTKLFFASVFSPLPLIDIIDKLLFFDDLTEINTILNSRTNFILSEMEKDKISMKETIKKVKRKCLIAKETELDLRARDSLYQSIILANYLYNVNVDIKKIKNKGIKGITSYDLIYADELGYKIKLLTTIRKEKNKLYLGIRPTLIKKEKFLASTTDNYNAVEFKNNLDSKNIFQIKNSQKRFYKLILTDLIKSIKFSNNKIRHDKLKHDKIKLRNDNSQKRYLLNTKNNLDVYDLYQAKKHCFYIRIQVEKNKNVKNKIKDIFSKKNISDLVLHDSVTETPLLPIIIITKNIMENKLKEILKKIEKLEGVLTINNILVIQKEK